MLCTAYLTIALRGYGQHLPTAILCSNSHIAVDTGTFHPPSGLSSTRSVLWSKEVLSRSEAPSSSLPTPSISTSCSLNDLYSFSLRRRMNMATSRITGGRPSQDRLQWSGREGVVEIKRHFCHVIQVKRTKRAMRCIAKQVLCFLCFRTFAIDGINGFNARDISLDQKTTSHI